MSDDQNACGEHPHCSGTGPDCGPPMVLVRLDDLKGVHGYCEDWNCVPEANRIAKAICDAEDALSTGS